MRHDINCKECGKSEVKGKGLCNACLTKDWRKRNPDKVKSYNKMRYLRDREKITKAVRDYHKTMDKDKFGEQRRKARRKYYHKNKEKCKIHTITINKFEKDKKCSICGSQDNLEFHHWVYKIPVERKHFSTLCIPCHKIQHKRGALL